MNIDSIQNGFVIDHIPAGRGMKLYELLGLDSLECSIALIKNVGSNNFADASSPFLFARSVRILKETSTSSSNNFRRFFPPVLILLSNNEANFI